jgi:hypothetical protein
MPDTSDNAGNRASDWISIRTRLPENGQVVMGRTQFGREQRVTFKSRRSPHWEEPSYRSRLDAYALWRPIDL